MLLTNLVDRYLGSEHLNRIAENRIRWALILADVVAIDRRSELQRVFRYHGAVHKTINTYVAGVDLTFGAFAHTPPSRHDLPACRRHILYRLRAIWSPTDYGAHYLRVVMIPAIAGLACDLTHRGCKELPPRLRSPAASPGVAIHG